MVLWGHISWQKKVNKTDKRMETWGTSCLLAGYILSTHFGADRKLLISRSSKARSMLVMDKELWFSRNPRSLSVNNYSLEYFPYDVEEGDISIRCKVGAELSGFGDDDDSSLCLESRKVDCKVTTVVNEVTRTMAVEGLCGQAFWRRGILHRKKIAGSDYSGSFLDENWTDKVGQKVAGFGCRTRWRRAMSGSKSKL